MFFICECNISSVILFFVFLLGLLKLYTNLIKGIYKGNERLEGKTVIVTGASAGIGTESVKDLARRGARVVMLCRDMVKGEKVRQDIIAYTGNKNIVLKHIDFSSLASVRKCANEILCEEARIDILLNNAGAGGLPLHQITPDGMEALMQTNHFGPFLFTNILLGIYKGNERLEGKTVIVTGASAGIGTESVKDLARRGARVVMLCRDMVKGEKVRQDIIAYTGNKNIVLKHIDFSSLASVRKCANEILCEEARIDILLNNAGAGGLPLHQITPDGMEALMQTNHFGPFLFTNILLGIYKGNERLEGKTVIVTGASAGIGTESVKDLARRGARVVMLCRDMVKGEKVRQDIIAYTGNKNIVLKHIDFSSLASVRKCANEILCEEARIDILLNNAGAGGLPLHQITPDGMEALMQTNHFGPFLFTNILLGKIKESSPARIVNVSSMMHMFAKLDLDDLQHQKNVSSKVVVYNNTKLANNLFTIYLAEKLKFTGVTVNCLHPGVIITEITRNANYLWNFAFRHLVGSFSKTVWEGAQTSIFLCVSPSVEGVTGKYFCDCRESKPSKNAVNFALAEKLCQISEKAVQLKDTEKHY